MKSKNTLILLADDACQNPVKWTEYIRVLKKDYDILLVSGTSIFTYKHVLNIPRAIAGLKLLLLTRKNVLIFHPFGLIPFERNQYIHQLNTFLLICWLYAARLFHPDIIFKGSIKGRPLVIWETGATIRPHWLYLPGIFAEKACILQISSDIPDLPFQETTIATEDVLNNTDAVLMDNKKIRNSIQKKTTAIITLVEKKDDDIAALSSVIKHF